MSAQIIYSVVVRSPSTVLSEYTSAQGNFIQFAKTVISKVSGTNVKKSYHYEQYEFHILAERGFCFLVMVDKGFTMRIAYAALEDISEKFFAQFPEQVRNNAISYGLNDQFQKVQKSRVEFFNSPQADKLSVIRKNVDITKGIMMDNLDKLLERGEKIDILVQKTNVMVNISTDMKKQATQLRRDMWWRNKKMTLIIILLVIVVIWLILSFICGFNFSKC